MSGFDLKDGLLAVLANHFLQVSMFYSTYCMANLNALTLWVKFSADNILKYFTYFSQKTGFDISCKICMKCQILFSGKNKKNTINLSSAENAQSGKG